ncbi:patatin-like phospholipase family protein, partial [Rhizobium johnstonii]|uniref:patatin-like phospholipase family protein n=1 Tax=Rhizobium johnstonii TaxID=3019933 RepID=UPI003F99D8E1
MTTALVLGGGGVTGIAWETGLLHGLEEAGVQVRSADRLIGTSAGSTVAAQLASGVELAELYRAQVEGFVGERSAKLAVRDVVKLVTALAFTKDRAAGIRKLG